VIILKFGGIQKTSLIDYPGRISTVLFTLGCNLRCPFCHNWRLVLDPKPILEEEEVLNILRRRKQYINSIVITGGEPTIHKDLPLFIKKLKDREYNIKLDTNGFAPEILEECIPYVDYIALDVKTTLEKYKLLGAKDISPFLKTIDILKKNNIDYEFRCTVVPGFIDKENIHKIGEIVKGGKRFVFQQFIPENTLQKEFTRVKPYNTIYIQNLAKIMKKYVSKIILRI